MSDWKLLAKVRDELLPGLTAWAQKAVAQGKPIEFDMQVNEGGLHVKGYNAETKESAGFTLSEEAVHSGEYARQFIPSMQALLDELSKTRNHRTKAVEELRAK